MDWLLMEFPWADGQTIITIRAATWTALIVLRVAFDRVDRENKQWQRAECGQTPPVLFNWTKCSKCRKI